MFQALCVYFVLKRLPVNTRNDAKVKKKNLFDSVFTIFFVYSECSVVKNYLRPKIVRGISGKFKLSIQFIIASVFE